MIRYNKYYRFQRGFPETPETPLATPLAEHNLMVSVLSYLLFFSNSENLLEGFQRIVAAHRILLHVTNMVIRGLVGRVMEGRVMEGRVMEGRVMEEE